MDKILSKFDDNFKFVINDGNINVMCRGKNVCNIILYKIKIVVRFMNYDLTLSDVKDSTELLDVYIVNKKINV